MSNEINRINKLESEAQELRLKVKRLERLATNEGPLWLNLVNFSLKAVILYAVTFAVATGAGDLNNFQSALLAPIALASFNLIDRILKRWQNR